ncbi:MAG: hypothetical protein A4E42_01860 [Methanoregulaceae archaeon PtaU1.Bin222]|nr:MAG: hypothetical protein A4E42_01860 [Methanoregulaceae archaeon PtaU1.Bin222]
MYSPPDGPQEFFSLLVHGSEVLADLLDCHALNRGCPDHLGCPPDVLCDLPEGCPVFPYHHTGLLSLDKDFAGVSIKINIGDTGIFSNHGTDVNDSLFGVLQHVRPDHDPFPEISCEDLDKVCLVRELLGVISIDDQFRSLELNLRDGDTFWDLLVDLVLELFEPLFNKHQNLPKKVFMRGGPGSAL